MSHTPSQLPPLGSTALENAIFANIAQDESLAFATPSEGMGPNEKEEIMRVGREELGKKLEEEVKAIKIAADAQRTALKERIERLRQVELADITVCEIHMTRGIQKLREDIYGERTVPGPIRKLPGEMLSTIFRYHVEDDRSPWILAKVCKTWMHMAMRTPQLWCHLFILDEDDPTMNSQIQSYVVNGRREQSFGRMQVCTNILQLQAALDRSGAALPLSLKFSHYRYHNWHSNGMAGSTFLRFISHPLSERLGDLDIESADLKFLESVNPTTIGVFPLLRSMWLPYSAAPCIAKLLESASITSKALETAFFPWIHAMPAAYSFWSRLKRIRIGSAPTNATGLNQVIDQLGGLESLEGPVYDWPDRQTPIAVLGNIREIALNCFAPHLGRLHLPQLETLKFMAQGCLTQNRLSRYEQLSYPMLVNLEVSTDDANWHLYTAGAFPVVQNLTLTWRGDDVMPINTLEGLPSVRNVKLSGSSSSTYGILLFKALRLSDEPVLCPNLEKLSLGNSVRTPKSRLTPWIKKVIQFREDIGRPLQGITVKWRNKEATEYAGVPT